MSAVAEREISEHPGGYVEEAPFEIQVYVREPYLSQRGNPVGAKVDLGSVRDLLNPDEARRLSTALQKAAGRADAVNERALPHLQAFVDALAEEPLA